MNTQSKGIFNSFTLKMIAIVTMLIDHIGYIFLSGDSTSSAYTMSRAIGRIAFPIFCFLLVEGFQHTRSHVNYLIRLCIFAIISEIPFDLAFRFDPDSSSLFNWSHQNVFITLALGLISIFCLEELNNRRIYGIPLLLTWSAAYFSGCDYGVGGVLLINIFYLTAKNPGIQFVLIGLSMYLFFGPQELYGLFALPFIFLYNGKRGPNAKLIFYWFYPVHLIVLYLIHHYLI